MIIDKLPQQGKQTGNPGPQDYPELSRKVLIYAHKGGTRSEFLKEVSRLLFGFSGCDAIEIRMTDGDLNYRWEATRAPVENFKFQIMPFAQGTRGEYIPCSIEDSALERVCKSVATHQIDTTLPFFTKNGSFWTGDTHKVSNGKDEIQPDDSFFSLAMIPFVIDEKNMGLLQLKSKSKDFFTENEIELYESFSQALGIAAAGRRAQAALRERVKELSCLYGIARLVQRPRISLEGILEGIAQILPQAMQYHEIASSRIILDGRSYTTPGFSGTRYKISSPIVVAGSERGRIEVFYSEDRPELEVDLFLTEERNLLQTVASQIGLIIERKKFEEDQAKLKEQLRHADRLATLGQLAAGVAHELNEPLGSILGFAQLSKKTPGLPAQAQEDVDKIIAASLHAREAVKKLLYFARQMPTNKSEVDFNKIVKDGIYFLESRCAKEGIELVRNLDPDLPMIVADPAQLHQALVNLIVNAIQAMPGGGRLTLSTQGGEEDISLIVEDTGIGMSREILKQIFLPFFTTKGVGQGTGLGLAVVHGIVSSHGGTIKVDSKPGKGSRFEIVLPLSGENTEKEKSSNGNTD